MKRMRALPFYRFGFFLSRFILYILLLEWLDSPPIEPSSLKNEFAPPYNQTLPKSFLTLTYSHIICKYFFPLTTKE
jgi:hypothetical protein